MFSFLCGPTRRLAVAIVASCLCAIATSAFAIDGRTAVEACINSTASGERCVWAVNDKGEIDICNKSGCVYCGSAEAQCTAAKARPRPGRSLPLGSKVTTPIGAIEITPNIVKGSILNARCLQGFRECPGHGCIGPHDSCDPIK